MRNKIIFSLLLFIILIVFIPILLDKKNTKKEVIKKIYAFDTTFYLKLEVKDLNKTNDVLNTIEDYIIKMEKLTDRNKSYEGIVNLYDIKNNDLDLEYLTLDLDLYNLIKIGYDWYFKSNHYLDIGIGNLMDNYLKNDSLDNLDIESDIEKIELKGNKIKNNHVNIYLDDIKKGYVVDKISEVLNKNNIDTYFINTGSVVKVGHKDNNEPYKVGLEEPSKKVNMYEFLKVQDLAYTSINFYEKTKFIDRKEYTYYLNPVTKEPVDYIKGVTVLSKSALESSILSLINFYNEDKDLLKEYDAEAIYYYDKDNQVKTDGFSKYLLENEKV